MKPKVSINLCCYNSEKYLRDTLDSIVNQTYKDWELVIINDGSSDSTESIIYEYVKRGYPIIYHYQENKGLGYSRNEALKRSQGEYIAFIDHDDIWHAEKLERQLPLFNDPDVGLVYSDAESFNEKGDRKRLSQRKRFMKGYCFSSLLKDYFISISTVIIHHKVLANQDYWFFEKFNMVEEADFFMRIALKWKLDYVGDVLAEWRVHSGSVTWTKPDLLAEESEIMLRMFSERIPAFEKTFKDELGERFAWIIRVKAMCLWQKGENKKARSMIYKSFNKNLNLLALYILTFFPAKRILPYLYKIKGSVVFPR